MEYGLVMDYLNMTDEESTAMLRQAEQRSADMKNGDVRPQVDAWRTANPNAPREKHYDYPKAARDGALPDPANEESAQLPDEYKKPTGHNSGVYNANTGMYEYEHSEKSDSVVNGWIRKVDAALGLGKGKDNNSPLAVGWKVTRSEFRAAQIVTQGLLDMLINEPKILANQFETSLMLDSLDLMDKNRALVDPEYYASESERIRGNTDPLEVAKRWDERPNVKVIEPLDLTEQVVSEIGAFVGTYLLARRGLAPAQNFLRVNPTKFGNFLNRAVAGTKELVSGWYGDRGLAYGADIDVGIVTLARASLEEAYKGGEGKMESVGEFLAEIGVESEDLANYDPQEANGDMERADRFALEGGILGVILPLVLRGSLGTVRAAGRNKPQTLAATAAIATASSETIANEEP